MEKLFLGTFFSYEESDDSIVDSSIRESMKIDKATDSFKENIVKDSKIARLEEKKFRKDMESFLEDAAAIKDPQERLQEFREIRSYLEDGACPDLREKIEEKIAAEEELIKKAVNDKLVLQEKFGIEDPKDLEVKITRIVEEASLADKEAKDWKAIAEKLQAKLQETKTELSQRPTSAFAEWQRNKINELQTSLDEATSGAATARKEFEKHLRDMGETIATLKCNLEESNAKAAAAETALLEMKKQTLLDKRSLKESATLANLYQKEAEISNEKLLTENTELKSKNDKLNKVAERLSSKAKREAATSVDLKRSLRQTEGKLSRATMKNELLEERIQDNRLATQKAGISFNNASVEDYVNVLQESFGSSILPFKKELLSCRNLTEAKQKFYGSVLGRMKESREIDKLRIPSSTGISAAERASKLAEAGKKPIAKESPITRMRAKGWK